MIQIRQAKKGDWPKVLHLIKLYPKKLMQSPLPKIREFFVALENKQVIACCALEVYSRRLAEIRSLVVHPKFQRQGIGTRLIVKCVQLAKTKKIYEVLSITGSRKVFLRLGFRTFNREKYAMLKML